MQRRSFLRNASLSFGALALLNNKSFAGFRADDPWKIKMLRNNVGIFTEKGGTIGFLLNKKQIVVVDSEFPEQATHLITELKKQSDKPFELLINTHHHGDHSSGNISFKGIVEKVAAHTNSKANQERVAKEKKNEDQQLYPDTVYGDEGWHYKMNDEKIKTYYFGAAHTNGDSIIHFQHANIAHMGDLMFNRRHPFIDRSSGASVKNWITVLDKTITTFDNETVFIFGHAFDPEKVTGNNEDLKLFKDYLEKLYQFAESEIKAGKSKEEFIKNTAIPGVTEWKGDGIDRPLTAVYEELTTVK
ncbi:MAG TPA: MBL fold metallo-hydrolase [Panacibacter sp.]|nr:MBL fold metallo-hydrolase [Panacibacter sp.]